MGDVKQFLEDMPCEEMDRLVAYDAAHGVGLDRLIEIVRNGFVQLIGMWGDSNSFDAEAVAKGIDPWLKD